MQSRAHHQHPISLIQNSISRLLGSRHFLWLWYENTEGSRPPRKDFHLFTEEGVSFLFHAPSCRPLRLDPTTAALVELMSAPPETAKKLISKTAACCTVDTLKTTFQTYSALFSYLQQESAPPPSKEEPPPVKGELLMFGNLTCNMVCPYCLSREARAEASEGKAPKLMELETAKQSIRFIAEMMAGKAEHVYINFTLGGEPLLSLLRYRQMHEYCSEVSKETGTPITININTNGTAFTDEFFNYCEENGVQMAVSIDGPKEIHDTMRPFLSGKGTYDTIVKKLPRILKNDCPGLRETAVGAVLTALNPNPKRVYQHLIELGFRHVVVTPVREEPQYEWSLNEKTVEAFKRGYTEYVEWLLECLVNEDDRIYAAVIEHDFFGRFLIRVIRGSKQPYRCEAGRTTFGVSVDGGLYPCDSFVKLPQYRLGDVFNGIEPEKQATFLRKTMIDDKPVCKDCWARYQCGGGCYYTAALANRDHRVPYAPKCDLIRHCVELAIRIVAELEQRNPRAFNRLYSNVMNAKGYAISAGINE